MIPDWGRKKKYKISLEHSVHPIKFCKCSKIIRAVSSPLEGLPVASIWDNLKKKTYRLTNYNPEDTIKILKSIQI